MANGADIARPGFWFEEAVKAWKAGESENFERYLRLAEVATQYDLSTAVVGLSAAVERMANQ